MTLNLKSCPWLLLLFFFLLSCEGVWWLGNERREVPKLPGSSSAPERALRGLLWLWVAEEKRALLAERGHGLFPRPQPWQHFHPDRQEAHQSLPWVWHKPKLQPPLLTDQLFSHWFVNLWWQHSLRRITPPSLVLHRGQTGKCCITHMSTVYLYVHTCLRFHTSAWRYLLVIYSCKIFGCLWQTSFKRCQMSPAACNVISQSPEGAYTMVIPQQHRNCSFSIIYPVEIDISEFSLGQINHFTKVNKGFFSKSQWW